MAKNRSLPTKTPPTLAQIEAELRRKDYRTFCNSLREFIASDPSETNRTYQQRILIMAAEQAIDHGQLDDFSIVLREIDTLPIDTPEWQHARAVLHAQHGNVNQALQYLKEQSNPAPVVIGHLADRAVRTRNPEALPATLHSGYEAILQAFVNYEAGNDEAATEQLQAIGITSPFAEWKLFLRGMMAYAREDADRALENWKRLNPSRFPSRLARPLRYQLDEAFRQSLTPELTRCVQLQVQKLQDTPLIVSLRECAAAMGKGKTLDSFWRSLEKALPLLRREFPALVPRLAAGMYWVIINQGRPADLQKYRSLFGPHPDDPSFHRLLAIVHQELNDIESGIEHWSSYEKWLGTKPAGWPEPILQRARAIVNFNIGKLVTQLSQDDLFADDELMEAIDHLRKRTKKQKSNTAEDYFRRCIHYAPDWVVPVRELFDHYLSKKQFALAEALANDFLRKQPAELSLLEKMANLMQQQGRVVEAQAFWQRTQSVNPLDRTVRSQSGIAILSAARKHLIDGQPELSETLLNEHASLCEEAFAASYWALRAILAHKLKGGENPADFISKGEQVPGGRFALSYCLSVDAILAKLKPAQKTAWNQQLKSLLEQTPTPDEALQIYKMFCIYSRDGAKYTGQKTHVAKMLSLVSRSTLGESAEGALEDLMEYVASQSAWKVVKQECQRLQGRFSRNPVFKLLWVQATHHLKPKRTDLERISSVLRLAKELVESTQHEKQAERLRMIEQYQAIYNPPESFFDYLFGFSGR